MKANLQQLFTEFLWECEFVQKMRPETVRGYRQTFTTLLKLMPELTLPLITPQAIARFFKTLQERKRPVGRGIKVGIKKSTAATYWGKLNKFCGWLVARKYLKANPFKSLEYPAPVYEDKKFLKREQIEKILTAIHNHNDNNIFILKRNLALFYVLLFCGLRREEAIFLQIRDVDFERKILTIRAETSKSGQSRQLPLHSTTIMFLKDYLNGRRHYMTPFLFASFMRDNRLSYNGLKHLVFKLRRYSGVRFHLHQFRHTFAVNFLKTSNNVVKLKQLMGHKDIRMTMLYLRCLPTEEIRGDVEAMSIDNLV